MRDAMQAGFLMVFLFGLGIIVGQWFGDLANRRALSTLARLQRTGNPDAPPPVATGADLRFPSAEGAAQARVSKDSIERGADHLQAVAKDSGLPISRKQALEDAAMMLGQSPDALGGAR